MKCGTNRYFLDYFDQLYTSDSAFRRAWHRMRRKTKNANIKTLITLDHACSLIAEAVARIHAEAAAALALRLGALSESDFVSGPPPDQWIGLAMDADSLCRSCEAYAREIRLLTQDVRNEGGLVRIYGGVKSQTSIARKILSFQNGDEPLDLWDLIRFRLVASDLDSLNRLSNSVHEFFGDRIARCRNYYSRQRKGPSDPYRAIHFEIELRGGPASFGELQILTARREAVGLIDHAYLHRHSLDPLSAGHAAWLRDLSYTANICDLVSGPLPRHSVVLERAQRVLVGREQTRVF